jgi:hypothetical protein
MPAQGPPVARHVIFFLGHAMFGMWENFGDNTCRLTSECLKLSSSKAKIMWNYTANLCQTAHTCPAGETLSEQAC